MDAAGTTMKQEGRLHRHLALNSSMTLITIGVAFVLFILLTILVCTSLERLSARVLAERELDRSRGGTIAGDSDCDSDDEETGFPIGIPKMDKNAISFVGMDTNVEKDADTDEESESIPQQ